MNKATIRAMLVHSGFYRPVMFVCRHLLRRSDIQRFRQIKNLYAQFVRPGDLCFDVGANVGQTAEVLLALDATVVSVEPNPACIAEMKARFPRNQRLQLVPKAIGAKEGTAMLHIHPFSFISSLNENWAQGWTDHVEVTLTTLDALIIAHGRPRFLKIDVEGFELEVLKGLSHPIEFVSFEYHTTPDEIAKTLACIKKLAQLAPIEINLTPAEQGILAFDQWLTSDAFSATFQEYANAHPDEFGDTIIRSRSPNSELKR